MIINQRLIKIQISYYIYPARSENIELIKKNYGKKIILIDRFIDSTVAYQHYGMGVEFKNNPK